MASFNSHEIVKENNAYLLLYIYTKFTLHSGGENLE